MKLTIISGIVLVLILAAGIFTEASISKLCKDTGEDMERIILLAENGDFREAALQLDEDIKKWQNHKAFFAVLQHHEMYDNLYSALMRAKQYASFENSALLAGEAAALVGLLEDIRTFDLLTIENIL